MATALRTLDADVEAASADVRREYLDSRKSLHLAGNNRPKVPTSAYAQTTHKAIVDDDSRAIAQFVTVLAANVELGMPWDEAVRPLRRIEAFLAARYAAKHAQSARARSLVSAIFREQHDDNAFDVHELRVVENQRCPDVARAALAACRAQLRSTQEAEAALEAHLVALTVEQTTRPTTRTAGTATRRSYGVRRAERPSMVLA